jgi:hypothetical protein
VLEASGDITLLNSTILVLGANTTGKVNGQWAGVGGTIIAANVTVGSGSAISADRKGYGSSGDVGYGPGGGAAQTGGGGYGVVPGLAAGADLGFSLSVQTAKFSLERVGLSSAGNAGFVTIPVYGECFASGMTVFLRGSSGQRIAATSLALTDSASAAATFDLRGAASGTYDVLVDSGNVEKILAGAFAISGGAAKGGLLVTTIQLPQGARQGRTFTAELVYTNAGDADISAPLISIVEISSDTTVADSNDPSAELGNLNYLGINQGSAAPQILPPGTSFSIPFEVTAGNTAWAQLGIKVDSADDSELMDYAALQAAVTPMLPHPLWQQAWACLVAECGTTRGSYVQALGAAAARAKGFGQSLVSEKDILQFLVREAIEQVQPSVVAGTACLGDSSAPLGRVLVVLNAANGTQYVTTSWYDGTFGVNNVPAGTYNVGIGGYLPATLATITVMDPVNSPVRGLVLTATSLAATISGQVTNGTSGPAVANAMVTAKNQDTQAVEMAQCDSAGSYLLSNLTAGTYAIDVIADGMLPQVPRTITVTDGQQARIPLVMSAVGGAIQGVVRSDQGSPVAGAAVTLTWAGGDDPYGSWTGESTDTDATGHYVFSPLPAGTYTILASFASEAPASQSVILADTTPVSVDITLGVPHQLTGAVLDADTQAPVVGAIVAADGDTSAAGLVITDVNGLFVISNLAAGTHEASVQAAGYATTHQEVTLADSTTHITIDTPLAGEVWGTVSVPGKVVGGIPVRLISPTGLFWSTVTSQTGRYTFTGVLTGDYSVAIGSSNGLSLDRTNFSLTDQQRSLQVDLGIDLSTISGQTLAADGTAPVADILVSLVLGNQVVDTTTSDAQGQYRFVTVQAGTFTILAQATETDMVFLPLTNVVVGADAAVTGQDLTASAGQINVHVTSAADG